MQDLQINSLTREYFHKGVLVTQNDIKAFHKFIHICSLIHVHSPREKQYSNRKISFLFVYLWYWGLNSGSTLEPLDQPYFCGLFWDRVSRSICPSSHWTPILLISACWMARITAVSHRYPAEVSFLIAGQIFKARWIWCHSTVFTYTSCRENSTFLLKGYMNFWGLSFNSIKWLSSYNSKWMGPDLMTKKTAKWWQQCFLTLSLHHEHGHSNDCDTLDLQPRDGVL
jgi:hypothetical protein